MTIKLENLGNRNFNGVGPGETINVEEENKNTYIVAGFKEVEVEVKTTDEVEKTKAELVIEAKELGLEFPKNIGKAKLQALIDEVEVKTTDEVDTKIKEEEK